MIVRSVIMGLALPLFLAACDRLVEEDSVFGQVNRFIGESEVDPRFQNAVANERPALQLGLVNRDIQSIVMLDNRRAGIDTWISSDGAGLVTQNGMLRGASGLEQVWLSADISQPLTLVSAMRGGVADRFHTYLNGEDQAVTRTYRCVVERSGPREVNLGARVANAMLMRETCMSLDDQFFNLYWVENGRIIQARQWAGPEVGAISTRIVAR